MRKKGGKKKRKGEKKEARKKIKIDSGARKTEKLLN